MHLLALGASPGSEARSKFVGLLREGSTVGARVEYVRPEGGVSAFVLYDPESVREHIARLESEGRDTAEERVALSALITATR